MDSRTENELQLRASVLNHLHWALGTLWLIPWEMQKSGSESDRWGGFGYHRSKKRDDMEAAVPIQNA